MTEHQKLVHKRYFRKTIGHPEGSVCHDGDCHFFGSYVCTCGLLHAVSPYYLTMETDFGNPEDIYPKYWEEANLQTVRLDQIRDLPKPVVNVMSEEEVAQLTTWMEEQFKKNSE